MATVLQSRITERRGRRVNDGNVFVIAAVAALAGLASAAVIGWGTGFWEVAVLFAGAMLASTAIALTVNLFRRGRRITAQAMDRGALTASINTVAEPLMVTDLKGAIICANQAYGSRFGGYPALADLGDDPVQMAGRIGQAGARAQAQSGAELQVTDPRSGAAVTLAVSMLGGCCPIALQKRARIFAQLSMVISALHYRRRAMLRCLSRRRGKFYRSMPMHNCCWV
jgi:hypothetical protein